MAGAGPAAPVKVSLRRDGAEVDFATPGKVTGVAIRAGDIVVMQSAGGGGYGDPLAREPDRVRDDVLAGYVSLEPCAPWLQSGPRIEWRRSTCPPRRQSARDWRRRDGASPVTADEREPYEGRLGRHRVLRMPPAMAADLGLAAGDLIELRGRHPAPLRAWLRIDAGAREGVVALDAFGRRILGISPGDTVEVRHLPMPPIPGGLVSG